MSRRTSTKQAEIRSNTPTNSQSNSQSSSQSSKPTGQLWLVKLPNFLADHFKRQSNSASANAAAAPLAQFHVQTNEDGSQSIRLRYQPTNQSNNQPPCDFLLKPRSKRGMLVFQDVKQVNDIEPAPCKFVGPVTCIADATPLDGPAYRAFLSQRAIDRSNRVSTKNLEEEKDIMYDARVMQALEEQERKKRKKKSDEVDQRPAKKFRAEREEVEAMLLRAFSASKYLSLKQLEEATQQPKQYLQEILKSMCDRENSGDFKDKYRLNDKYMID